MISGYYYNNFIINEFINLKVYTTIVKKCIKVKRKYAILAAIYLYLKFLCMIKRTFSMFTGMTGKRQSSLSFYHQAILANTKTPGAIQLLWHKINSTAFYVVLD